jgi:hypothetical protein
MARPIGIPEFVQMMEPLMRELLYLREEVQRLRLTTYTRSSISDLFNGDGTPLKLRQDDDGKWSFSLNLSDEMQTGGSGFESEEAALRHSVQHAADLYRQLETDTEDF